MKYTDQTGHTIDLHREPTRIVSVVPSQTELLYDLGLEEEVVGITKFCVHPREWFESKQRVGGTKKLNIPVINDLQPDLIIANKEENTEQEIRLLQQNYPVWTSDIKSFRDALEMIAVVGDICGRAKESQALITGIEESIYFEADNLGTALYIIWEEPTMAAGNQTFINAMMAKAGFRNTLGSDGSRYPELTDGQINEMNPDFILLSSEPFPFKQKHQKEWQARFPKQKVILVDGELFSWYGSRMLKAAKYFRKLSKKVGN